MGTEEYDVRVTIRVDDAGSPRWHLAATSIAGNEVASADGVTLEGAAASLADDLANGRQSTSSGDD